nr:hypothetical protein [bacterium]
MDSQPSQIDWALMLPLAILVLLGLVLAAARFNRDRFALPGYLAYFWIFLLICVITDFFSFT